MTRLIEKGVNPIAYRFFCLQSHYRRQLCYTPEALESACTAYDKLISKMSKLKTDGDLDTHEFEKFDNKFKDCLSNDVNTSTALTVVFDVLKSNVNDTTKIALLKSFDKVLGLDFEKAIDGNLEKDNLNIDEKYILEMIEKRKEAKLNKDYALADSIRNELLKKGIELIDTKEGTTYKVK